MSVTPSEIEPATLQLEVQCLNQLSHLVHRHTKINFELNIMTDQFLRRHKHLRKIELPIHSSTNLTVMLISGIGTAIAPHYVGLCADSASNNVRIEVR